MTQESVSHDRANPSTEQDQVLDRIELELSRLREKRPALESCIERAEHILVAHLALKGKRRSQIIRVRIGLGGRAKFLVSSLRERGATYVVAPSIWGCTCPAYHRRGGPCKHVLAAFVLWQAGHPEIVRGVCAGCAKSCRRGELVEVQHEDHNEHFFPGDLLCAACADRSGVLR